MKLAISNIAWKKEQNEMVYSLMKQFGIVGLEIAPTHFVEDLPYSNIKSALDKKMFLEKYYGFTIPSMQSLLFGQNLGLFKNKNEREEILTYLKKAVDFAASLSINNLVFGSPKNRYLYHLDDLKIAFDFFTEIGTYANSKNTIIAIEPNPRTYGTNFLNTTKETFDFVMELDHPGVRINLDIGTIIENNENFKDIEAALPFVNHIHLSEPYLMPIKYRELHKEIIYLLKLQGYEKFISIEMKYQQYNTVNTIKKVIQYLTHALIEESYEQTNT